MHSHCLWDQPSAWPVFQPLRCIHPLVNLQTDLPCPPSPATQELKRQLVVAMTMDGSRYDICVARLPSGVTHMGGLMLSGALRRLGFAAVWVLSIIAPQAGVFFIVAYCMLCYMLPGNTDLEPCPCCRRAMLPATRAQGVLAALQIILLFH